VTTFAIQCSECEQLDTSDPAPLFSTDSDGQANAILTAIDWRSWQCPTCGAGPVYATIAELA
jgi:hypothetical protein